MQQEVEVVGSGRTDTGVHARTQVAHLDLPPGTNALEAAFRVNAMLPADVYINSLRQAKPNAHARFDATHRSYQYFIHTRKDPFKHGLSTYFNKPLQVEAMNQAAANFLHWQDFQSFSRTNTQVNHFNCQVTQAHWQQQNETLVFNVSANRFLRGMVRAMVGTLLSIGTGSKSIDHVLEVLAAKDRTKAGVAAPPQGLYLTDVQYPTAIFLEKQLPVPARA